eukprot:gene3509-4009_t
MEIECLLQSTHEEDNTFTSEFMRHDWKGYQIEASKKQTVELPEMGHSMSRNNKIINFAEDGYESKMANSLLKLEIDEILELKSVFKRLARLSPGDQFMSKQTFLHYFPLEGKLAERLFNVFDRDNDGRIDAYEFLSGISLCLRGSLSNKCQLLFNMFDLDGDEGISEDELFNMLKPTLKAADSLAQQSSGESTDKSKQSEDFSEVARLLVHEAFEECDLQQSGKLSSESFQKWLSNHRELVKAIFNNPFQSVMRRRKFEELKPQGTRSHRIQPQTWMDEVNDDSDSWPNGVEPGDNLDNAVHLWSPIFPKAASKFPPSRQKHANVLYNGSIYMFGGRSKTASLKDIWIYDIGENIWQCVETQDGARPPSLQEHSVVVYKASSMIFTPLFTGDNAYIFGGAFTTGNEAPFWSYNFDTSTWKNLSRSKFQKEPSNLRCHSAAVYKDSMYLFGGFLDSGASTNDIWQYNFTTFRWHLLTPRPGCDVISARHSHASIVHNRALWVFGGLDNRGRKNDLWRWNFDLSTWSKIRCRNNPPPVSGHTCSKVGCLLVVFGGENNTELKNESWAFNLDSCKWTKVTPFSSISPTIRSQHTAVVLNPYSIHSGLINVNRPNTTRSAPDPTNYDYRSCEAGGGYGVVNNRYRAASAESLLSTTDYHQKRLMKGKSLDLQFIVDNDGFEGSFVDVNTNEFDNDNKCYDMWSANTTLGDLNRHDYEGRAIGDPAQQLAASQRQFDEVSTATTATTANRMNWAVIVIGGKGRLSSDMYKTTVDIWKCDIGTDVGVHHIKTITVKEQNTRAMHMRSHTAKPRAVETQVIDMDTSVDKSPSLKQKLISEKNSKHYDQLIITDLTSDIEDSCITTSSTAINSHWESRNLLL